MCQKQGWRIRSMFPGIRSASWVQRTEVTQTHAQNSLREMREKNRSSACKEIRHQLPLDRFARSAEPTPQCEYSPSVQNSYKNPRPYGSAPSMRFRMSWPSAFCGSVIVCPTTRAMLVHSRSVRTISGSARIPSIVPGSIDRSSGGGQGER